MITNSDDVQQLWFDVGIKRYTTDMWLRVLSVKLWFDVGIKRYTTPLSYRCKVSSCGLM